MKRLEDVCEAIFACAVIAFLSMALLGVLVLFGFCIWTIITGKL